MALPKKRIPTRLRHDAIAEALLEVRFSMATIPEIFLGRIADSAPWNGFEQGRMPAYDLPAFVRQNDPNLRYQPIFELHNVAKSRALRIGGEVLSYHRLPPYESWEQFKPELDSAIDALFAHAKKLTIRRLGLRYINAIKEDLHQISSIAELDLTVAVETRPIGGNLNVNFTTDLSADTQCTVRVATPEFAQGLPAKSCALIDVDVFTKDSFVTEDAEKVKQWVMEAHTWEKEQFFRLLTQQTIDALEVK
jgi:uncharacterized protein (TIGR04255 family)